MQKPSYQKKDKTGFQTQNYDLKLLFWHYLRSNLLLHFKPVDYTC